MSSQVFPVLAGEGWDIDRTPTWQNTRQRAFSGAEVSVSYWSYPMWTWEVRFNILRQGVMNMPSTTYTEFAQLAGFFNQMYGNFDSFLYADLTDNSVTDQVIGVGDSVETEFQLVRAFGNFVEPIFAPNVITNVKVNGVVQTPVTDYSVSVWGDSTPGVVTFTSPPGNGLDVTVTYSYYFPCRFDEPTLTFTNFLSQLFKTGGVPFSSIKLGA